MTFSPPAVEPKAWLLMAVGDDRQHGGNDGYDDDPDVHYSWDSTVANDGALQVGDPIALWDKRTLLGTSVIEEIEVGNDEKILRRCPSCGTAGIKARKRKTPLYKCYKCKAEFDSPTTKIEAVTTYRSRHDAGWQDFQGVLSGAELRSLCVSPKSQLSLRPLRWQDLLAAIGSKAGPQAAGDANLRVPPPLPGGHVRKTVRVRVGQRGFRDRLLERQGPVCAFTGPAPAEVLEAGHLYSYAALGVHDEHGGLMLRRDIHRLFDRGHLAVNPVTLQADVVPPVAAFSQYAALHGLPMQVPVSPGQVEWLRQHWEQHRT